MAENSKVSQEAIRKGNQALTPSNSEGSNVDLKDVLSIVGDLNSNVESFLESYKESSEHLATIVSSVLEPISSVGLDYLKTIRDMSIAIAGAIYGDKSIKETTSYNQLLSKISSIDIKNTAFKGLQPSIVISPMDDIQELLLMIDDHITERNASPITIPSNDVTMDLMPIKDSITNLEGILNSILSEITKPIPPQIQAPETDILPIIDSIKNLETTLQSILVEVSKPVSENSLSLTAIESLLNSILVEVSKPYPVSISQEPISLSTIEGILNSILTEISKPIPQQDTIDLNPIEATLQTSSAILSNIYDILKNPKDNIVKDSTTIQIPETIEVSGMIEGFAGIESRILDVIEMMDKSAESMNSQLNLMQSFIDQQNLVIQSLNKPLSGPTQAIDYTSQLETIINQLKEEEEEGFLPIDFSDVIQAIDELRRDFSPIDGKYLQDTIDEVKKLIDKINDKLQVELTIGSSDSFNHLVDILSDPTKFKNLDDMPTKLQDFLTKLNNAVNKIEISDNFTKLSGVATEYNQMLSHVDKIMSDANKTIHNSRRTVQDTSNKAQELFYICQSIFDFGSFDTKGFKNMSENIRKLSSMFDPNPASRILLITGVSTRGLLTYFFQNIKNSNILANEAKVDAKSISDVLSMIVNIASMDPKKLDEMYDNLADLNAQFDPDESNNVYTLVKKITSLANYDLNNIKVIGDRFSELNDIIRIAMKPGMNLREVIQSGIAVEILEVIFDGLSKISIEAKNIKTTIDDKKNIDAMMNIAMSIIKRAHISQKEFIDNMFFIVSINSLFKTLHSFVTNLSKIDVSRLEDTKKNVAEIVSIMNELNRIAKSEDILKVSESIKILSGINMILAMNALFGIGAIAGAWMMKKTVRHLNGIVNNFNEIELDPNYREKLTSIGILVLGIGGVILLASMVGKYAIDNWLSTMFMSTLIVLMTAGLTKALAWGTKDSKSNIENANEIVKLILACAGVIFLASIIGTNGVMFAGAMAFLLEIGLFFGVLCGMFVILSKFPIQNIENQIKSIIDLILVSTACLTLAGLFMMIPSLAEGALKFLGVLALFTFSILAIYVGAAFVLNRIGGGIEISKNLADLVWKSTLPLIIGGLFMMIPNMPSNALKFVGVFALFITGILLAYSLASLIANGKSLKVMKDLNKLIMISAATLIIGGLFMFIPGMAVNTLIFAAILVGFITIVSIAVGFASKIAGKSAILSMIGIAAIVLISGGILLYAGYLIGQDPSLIPNIWKFLGVIGVLIAGMGMVMYLIKTFLSPKDVVIGLLALGGIALITWAMAKNLKILSEVNAQIISSGGHGQFQLVLAEIAEIIVGMGMLMGGIGALATNPMVALALAIGAGVILAISGLVRHVANTIRLISQVAVATREAGTFNPAQTIENIKGFASIFDNLGGLLNPLNLVKGEIAQRTTRKLSTIISDISSACQSYANLKVPIYDENGKFQGYRNMSNTDFENAANNISAIITTVGNAIMAVYEKDTKGIFNPTSFFGNTPFANIVNSSMKLGTLIKNISQGLKGYSDLMIPEFDRNGKVTGYRRMELDDFKRVGLNISEILLTLGKSIINTYNSAPGMFDKPFLGDTPFKRVLDSMKPMGDMLKSYVEVIQNLANLRIPEEYDKDGKCIKYRPFDFDKDSQNVATNVNMILTTVANAVSSVAKNNKDLFKMTDKIKPVMEGLSESTKVINAGIDSIKKIEDPEFARILNDGGLDPTKIDISDLSKSIEGSDIYKRILATLASVPQAILNTYESNKDLFDTGFLGLSDSPLQKINDAITSSKEVINIAVDNIKKINDLYKEIDNGDISNIVQKVIEAIPTGIYRSVSGDNIEKVNDSARKKIGEIINTYKKITPLTTELVKTYTNLTKASRVLDTQNVNAIHAMLLNIMSGDNSLHGIILKGMIIKNIEEVHKAYAQYRRVINEIIKTYKSLDSLSKELNDTNGNVINNINNKLKSMVSQMNSSMKSEFELDSNQFVLDAINFRLGMANIMSSYQVDLPESLTSIEPTISSVNYGIENLLDPTDFLSRTHLIKDAYNNLFSVFDKVPTDDQRNLVQLAIASVNKEIENTPDQDKFTQETDSIHNFVQKINQVDISKTNSMTQLLRSLNDSFSSRNQASMQNLFNELIAVMAELVNELNMTHQTMNKADEIQKRRQEAIRRSIEEVNKLLDNPIKVTVNQAEEDDINQDRETNGAGSPSRLSSSTPSSVSNTFGARRSREAIEMIAQMRKQLQQQALSNGGNDGVKS